MFELRPTETFRRRLRSKTPEDFARVIKAMGLLRDNPRHPSLRTKRMHAVGGIWEARASRSLRLTFQLDGSTIILRNNCKHDETLGSP